MKFINKKVLISTVALLFLTLSTEVFSQDSEVTEIKEQAPQTVVWPDLAKLGKEYRINPTSATWLSYINALKSHLSEPLASKSTASQIINSNPSLKDFQVKVFDASGARVWLFPNAIDNKVIYLQTGQTIHQIDYPDSINIQDAQIVRSTTTKTKVIRRRRRRIRKKVVTVTGPSYLILAGVNRVNGNIWLSAFKAYNGSWVPTYDPFKNVPPYLLKNVSGSVAISGNNIVMSVSASNSKSSSKLPKPNSTSYRIVLHNSGGKFHLAGANNTNQPVSIITQFVNSIRNNRIDLAKAWLHDPQLISIPKYVGLVGANAKPFKLVAMAHPKTGGPRYRLVTYKKYDLIFDLGSRRGRLAIKGLFIAPPDPLAKELSGTYIGLKKEESPEASNKN